MTAAVDVGGPPVGARWCRSSRAVRATRAALPGRIRATRDSYGRLRPVDADLHASHRRALAAELAAWDADRVVHIWQDPDSELWHVAVTDGWGRRLAHVTPGGLPHDDARRVARRVWCHLRDLAAEAAA